MGTIVHLACAGYYCGGILCFSLYGVAPSLFERYSLVAHGKAVAARDPLLLVPKRLFSLFYAVGIISAMTALPFARLREWLLLGHLTRRLVETWTWPHSWASRMHLVHAAVGLSFYPILSTSLALAGQADEVKGPLSILLLFLFLGASLWQALAHRALYQLRCRYPDHCPLAEHSRLFRHILCPHYAAEIILYACLAAMASFHPLLLLACLFVMANLAISAVSTRAWYVRRFSSHHAGEVPAALLPLCL